MDRMAPAPGDRSSPNTDRRGGRYESLDVLRGFSVLGIYAINIWHFSLPQAFYSNPQALGILTGSDAVIWHVTALLVSGKFYTLFSVLFGAGIVLMAGRAGGALHRRRLTVLLGMGLMHAYLIWPGDILVSYALCGFLAAPLRTLAPRTLMVIGVALIALAGLLTLGFGSTLATLSGADLAGFEAGWRPAGPAISEEIALRGQGSWLDQVPWNASQALASQLSLFIIGTGWRILGLMALGMALLKSGFLTGQAHTSTYRFAAIGGLGVGLPLVEAGIRFNEAAGWDLVAYYAAGIHFNFVGSLFVAAGYAGLVLWIVRLGHMAWLRQALAATGRLAFSNYLMQSLITVTLMQGFGFGLFGAISVTGLAGLVLGLWLVQITVSVIWVRMIGRGPFEAVWRWLTYGYGTVRPV